MKVGEGHAEGSKLFMGFGRNRTKKSEKKESLNKGGLDRKCCVKKERLLLLELELLDRDLGEDRRELLIGSSEALRNGGIDLLLLLLVHAWDCEEDNSD